MGREWNRVRPPSRDLYEGQALISTQSVSKLVEVEYCTDTRLHMVPSFAQREMKPGRHMCPEGSIAYSRWVALTGNNPVVLFNERLGNPAFTCVQPTEYPLQPVCPHTNGKAMVFPLISVSERVFLELVPALYNLSAADEVSSAKEVPALNLTVNDEEALMVNLTSHPLDTLFEYDGTNEGIYRRLQAAEEEHPFLRSQVFEMRSMAQWLFDKNRERMDMALFLDPVDFQKLLSPEPRSLKLMGELWHQWLQRELYVPVCVEMESRKPYARCPETHLFGADGTCKPLDYSEMEVFCPVDYQLDQTSLPIFTEAMKKRPRYTDPKGKDTLRPVPRCVGKIQSATELFCPNSVCT